jgi:hypothetical protein
MIVSATAGLPMGSELRRRSATATRGHRTNSGRCPSPKHDSYKEQHTMSKTQNPIAVVGCGNARTIECPALILEKQLMDTIDLACHLQETRMRSNGEIPPKIRRLFDGMSSELRTAGQLIRKGLESLKREAPHDVKPKPALDWRLFPADSLNVRDQLESLLCGYAHYARRTSEAITSLQRQGELESLELLATIFKSADQCLWFLEIYLESMALNSDTNRLPDWPACTAS